MCQITSTKVSEAYSNWYRMTSPFYEILKNANFTEQDRAVNIRGM